MTSLSLSSKVKRSGLLECTNGLDICKTSRNKRINRGDDSLETQGYSSLTKSYKFHTYKTCLLIYLYLRYLHFSDL